MLANLIRKHGQNLLGEPVHRTTEGQLAMRDALARAKLELQAGMQLVIDRNNNDICELLAIIDARSAALKRMQRAVRAPTPVSDSQQQQLSTLQASLDEVRRKRDVAVGENNRLLRKLRELQVEVDGLKQLSLKQLSSSVDRAFASATPASCATTRSGIGAVASTSDARRYAEEQADADAHLKEMEALARKREGELQRMRKDVAQFDTRYESALSELMRAQASAARRKIERAVSSQGRQEAESVKRHTERRAAAAQLEQRAALCERQEKLYGAEVEALHRTLQASEMAMQRDGGAGEQSDSRATWAAATWAAATRLERGSSSGRPSATTMKTISDASSMPQTSASLFLQSFEQDAADDSGRVDASNGLDVKRGAADAHMAAWALLVRESGVAEPRDVAERLALQRNVDQARTFEREAEVKLRQLVDETRVLRDRHDWLETAIGKAADRRHGQLSESVAASSEKIEAQSKQRAAHTAALVRAQAAINHLRARWPFPIGVTAESGEGPDAAQLAAILARLCASIREVCGEDFAPEQNPTSQVAARTAEKRAALDALLDASKAAADQKRRAATASGELRPASSAAARLPGTGRRPTPSRRNAVRPRSATHGRASLPASRTVEAEDHSTLGGSHISVLDDLFAADCHTPLLTAPPSISTADLLTATDRLLGGLVISG